MRTKGNTDAYDLYYFLTDQVNSTSKTVKQNGDVSEIRYTAWGETRSTSEPTVLVPTDRKYTGQIEDEAGLYFYNARWYDPALGRFVQADTLVPDPSSPISWDRYAYTVNNPIRFSDPSGHVNCDEDGNCYLNPGERTPYQTASMPKINLIYTPSLTEKQLGVQVNAQPRRSTSCGESAFTSAWNYKHPNSPLRPLDVIQTAVEKEFYKPSEPPYTAPSDLVDLANYYAAMYGYSEVKAGNVDLSNEEAAKDFLVDQIRNGNPIIIDVNLYIATNTEGSHFITVIGYAHSGNEIIYADSYGYVSDAQPYVPGIYSTSFTTLWETWRNNADGIYYGNGFYLVIQ